jgi:hypothetical protein
MTSTRARHVSASSLAPPALTLSLLCLCLYLVVAAVVAGEKTLDIKLLAKPTEATSGVPLLVTATIEYSDGGGGDAGDGSGDGDGGDGDSGGDGNDAFGAGGSTRGLLFARLHYRAMFEEEKSVPMQGTPGNLYAASIPAADLPGYGQMVRYWITAKSHAVDGAQSSVYARKPTREADAYGAVVGQDSPNPDDKLKYNII